MRSTDIRNLVKAMKSAGKSYNVIGETIGLSKKSVRGFCRYKCKAIPKKTGPKPKIGSKEKLRIKREISRLNDVHEKINCTKIIKNC